MLFTILLLEGFITISIEIVTIRQLLPFFGGSVVITSIIIGFFLLFLAIGYWRGGHYQNNFLNQLRHNFTFSLFWLGIGLSYTAILGFYYVTTYQAHWPYMLSLPIYLLIVLAPIVYWLGQTIPLTTHLFNQEYGVSRVSGQALFLSTIGSFLGALLTSLILFQYLGVAWTVVINCFLLLCLIIYLRADIWQITCLFFALALITILNLNVERSIFKQTNNYGNYSIIETPAFSKILRINESSSSLLTQDKNAFPYIQYVRKLLFEQLHLSHKNILVIGAGGFTLTAAGTHDNQVTYVDIDPDIRHIAEKHFLNEAIQGQFIGQDARLYLQKSHQQYDVIFSDVYSHQINIPPSLLTLEYFQALANHLRADGLLIINIIAEPFFKDEFAQTVFNTIHAVFPYCALTVMDWRTPLANMMYVCPKVASHKKIYRDDLNKSTFDFFNSRYVADNNS